MQTILVPVYGGTGPLWSIANEFWYYVCFPLLLLAVMNGPALWRLGYAVAAVAVLFFVGPEIAALFPIWLMGYAAYKLLATKAGQAASMNLAVAVAFAAIFVVALLGIRVLGLQDDLPGQYALGIGSMLAVIAGHHSIFAAGKRIGNFLSQISYSLYLTHFPVLAFIAAATGNKLASTFEEGIGIFVFANVVAFGASCVVYWAFERHTPAVRHALMQFTAAQRQGRQA